jgi:TonB family protein
MSSSMHRIVLAVAAISIVTAVGSSAEGRPTDAVANGKALYESADYERALEVLQQIDAATSPPEQLREAAVYRGLCLLALNRSADAEHAIQQLLERDPFYVPGTDITPRMRGIVDDVRERVRPMLVREHYKAGKQQFDNGNAAAALDEFRFVLRLIDEAPAADVKASFDDIRMVASGFRDLADRSRPAAAAPASAAAPVTTGGPVMAPPVADKGKGAVGPTSIPPTIIPPTTIRQYFPPLSGAAITAMRRGLSPVGQIEVVIDEQGNVASARLIKGAYLPYDVQLLSAARDWKYRPATKDGTPVRFVKLVDFYLNPPK